MASENGLTSCAPIFIGFLPLFQHREPLPEWLWPIEAQSWLPFPIFALHHRLQTYQNRRHHLHLFHFSLERPR